FLSRRPVSPVVLAHRWHSITRNSCKVECERAKLRAVVLGGCVMPTIRERAKADGTRIFHVQVRISGFPARTASFPTRRQAERWSKTVEAEMIEGRHFRGAEARRRTVAEAIDRYVEEEVPKKRNGGMYAF